MLKEDLLKNLSGAVDAAVKELIAVETLSKGEANLQDAKLRPESANGALPGHDGGAVSDSALKPEDAKKAEQADKGDLHILHEDGDKAAKAEDKPEDKKDEKEDKKEDKKSDKDDDKDDDMDDDKVEQMKAKIKKYEDDKAAKAAGAPASMTKSDIEEVASSLTKSITSQVETMAKSFNDRIAQLEGVISKLVGAPQPRQSVSGLAPLAKSGEDVQPAAAQNALSKSQMIDKLFELQKSADQRVDSTVIARVEMGDFSVLAERGINLK